MFGAMEEFFMEMEVEEEVWLRACFVCPWKWNIILIYVCIHNVKRPKWPQLNKNFTWTHYFLHREAQNFFFCFMLSHNKSTTINQKVNIKLNNL